MYSNILYIYHKLREYSLLHFIKFWQRLRSNGSFGDLFNHFIHRPLDNPIDLLREWRIESAYTESLHAARCALPLVESTGVRTECYK